MWFLAAATTTHGSVGIVRQCVYGYECVNFLISFGLHDSPEDRDAGSALSRRKSPRKLPQDRLGKPLAGHPQNCGVNARILYRNRADKEGEAGVFARENSDVCVPEKSGHVELEYSDRNYERGRSVILWYARPT